MARRKKSHGLPHRFVSKAQWRYFFARARTNPKFAKLAHKEAHKTPGGPKIRYRHLPPRVGGPGKRTIRKAG